ncbi:MAG: hypothetical protein ACOZCL_06320 [Bacillota bacterium]
MADNGLVDVAWKSNGASCTNCQQILQRLAQSKREVTGVQRSTSFALT